LIEALQRRRLKCENRNLVGSNYGRSSIKIAHFIWPTRKVWRYQRGNQNGKSHDRQDNDRSDYHFDIFKLFLLVIVLPVMWVTVLITPLISSNFPCWSLYFLSCDLPFCLPLWYLQTFLVGHCIACHVIFKSHDMQYNDQQEKFEDIKGVIRTVNHMTSNAMTNKESLKISKG
jgi:hypothetical protein